MGSSSVPVRRGRALTINCDMGEGYGQWKMGPDEEIMPLIDVANVACGFHGGDPSVMVNTVRLAKKHNVPVGAHPGLPDLMGFGRRAMKIDSDDLRNLVLYQVAALDGILRSEGLALNHIKPHGQLYMMISTDEDACRAVYEVARIYDVPVIGLPRTAHEKVAQNLGLKFIPEFFPDVKYDRSANLAVMGVPLETVVDKVRQAILEDTVTGTDGSVARLGFGDGDITFCVHSDLPRCVESALAVREGLRQAQE